jgi:membrane protein implicated in regulation of membrane protease activity
MATTKIGHIIWSVKIAACCFVIAVLFIGSLLLLPYESFFLSALIILLLLRFIEKNMKEYSSHRSSGETIKILSAFSLKRQSQR